MHVFALANETQSGVKIRWRLEKVIEVLKKEKKSGTPAFCDEAGYALSSVDMERVMHPILKKLQGTPQLENDIPNGTDIEKSYRCYRSFRRGAENTTLREGVSKEVIMFIHRWSEVERRKGKISGFDKLRHYADGNVQRPLMLEFARRI